MWSETTAGYNKCQYLLQDADTNRLYHFIDDTIMSVLTRARSIYTNIINRHVRANRGYFLQTRPPIIIHGLRTHTPYTFYLCIHSHVQHQNSYSVTNISVFPCLSVEFLTNPIQHCALTPDTSVLCAGC